MARTRAETRMRRFRDPLICLFLTAAVAYSLYDRLQTVTIFLSLMLIAVSYKNTTYRLLDILTGFLGRVDYAKFRDLELKATERLAQLSRLESVELTILQDVILRNLEPKHLALLTAIRKAGRVPVAGSSWSALSYLRDRGLIETEAWRFEDSRFARLTSLGEEIAAILDARPAAYKAPTPGTFADDDHAPDPDVTSRPVPG